MCLSVSFFKILVQSKIVNFYCNFCCSHSGHKFLLNCCFLMKPGVNCQAKRQTKKKRENNISIIFTGRTSKQETILYVQTATLGTSAQCSTWHVLMHYDTFCPTSNQLFAIRSDLSRQRPSICITIRFILLLKTVFHYDMICLNCSELFRKLG